MKERSVSRRDFLRGAGTVGVAAGAMAALGGAGVAVAAEEAAEAGESAYGLTCDTAWVPVRRWPAPALAGRWPLRIAIAADELAATEASILWWLVPASPVSSPASRRPRKAPACMCVEKMTRGRGCFECFGAVDAACQEGTEINKVHLIDEMHRAAYWRVRPEPARTYVDRSGGATDFLAGHARQGRQRLVITKVEQGPSSNNMPAVTPLIDTELGFYDSPCLPPDAGVRSGYSGIYVCLEMQEVAKQYPNMSCVSAPPAVQLMAEGDRVAGVIAKNPDGLRPDGRRQGRHPGHGRLRCQPRDDGGLDPSRVGLRHEQLVESAGARPATDTSWASRWAPRWIRAAAGHNFRWGN